jgi:hypothetical protein
MIKNLRRREKKSEKRSGGLVKGKGCNRMYKKQLQRRGGSTERQKEKMRKEREKKQRPRSRKISHKHSKKREEKSMRESNRRLTKRVKNVPFH